ncbi:MAG TPA: inositol monophosphatase family protein, partial [Candidatus Limnocylindrales bacterium]|nr:inositol monophosphatase family protein [Candidatus Limnocylindrales bacterium]
RLPSAADAVVSADPGDADDAEAAARIGRLRRRVRAIRTFGSTALSLAYLAAGRLDGVLQVNGLQSVDVAAGALVATLAGARVTAADGRPLLRSDALTDDAGIAAGRPAVHRLLVRR